MTLAELTAFIAQQAAHPEFVCIGVGEPIDDDHKYHILKNGMSWLVYYVERRYKSLERVFDSEDDACSYLLELVKADRVTWGEDS